MTGPLKNQDRHNRRMLVGRFCLYIINKFHGGLQVPKILIFSILTLAGLIMLLAGCGSESDSSRQNEPEAITPVRITFDDDLQLLTSDYQSRTLQLFDNETLALISSFAVNGSPLAVGSYQGNLFVGNETNQCVEVYSRADGEKLFDLGEGPGSIPVPNDLAIDTKYNRVFVVDSTNKRIAVFSVDGPLVFSITDPALLRPTAIVLDETNELLYVSDFGSEVGYILVFTYGGDYVRSIEGAFASPQGLALDDNDHLFMADALLGQVLAFDLTTDQEIYRFGDQGTYVGPHKMLLDLVFEPDSQQIYVTDHLSGQIEQFDTREMTP
jgi:DNA-binding beta-propeller fold protein YncE